jgi:hypothetical protein
MRKIEIFDDVRVRFPGRDVEFDLASRFGAISVLIAQGLPAIHREVSKAAAEQLRPIAHQFRYTLIFTDAGEDSTDREPETLVSKAPASRSLGTKARQQSRRFGDKTTQAA